MSSPLFDGPMDRIARSEDLHLLQALRRTAASLGDRPADGEPDSADRLRHAVRGLIDDVGEDRRTPARSEAMGEAHERFYNVDQQLVDRVRAALMAYHDRATEDNARLAAEAVEELAGADRG